MDSDTIAAINSLERRTTRLEESERPRGGWQLSSAIEMECWPAAGGMLGWSCDARSREGRGEQAANGAPWVHGGTLTAGDYFATTNGGPYIALNSAANDYLSIADAAWQEQATWGTTMAGFCWVSTSTIAAGQGSICGKYGAAGSRSWNMFRGTANLNFTCSQDCTNTTNVAIANAFTANVFTFCGYFYNPSTLMQVWSGLATASVLSTNTNAVGVPAALCNTGTALNYGANNAANFFSDKLGIYTHVWNMPAANVANWMTRNFQLTRWFYQA